MRSFMFILGVLATTSLHADDSVEAKIARAMSAAPDYVSAEATIMDTDGTLLRQGTNGWMCHPGVVPGDDHPMCNDTVWTALMAAMGAGKEYTGDRIGISYMLKGDMYVSNSDPTATDPNNGDVWVQEGPHLMIWVPREMLKGLTDDPYAGGPYVMWGDTPYAHIMVPLSEKLR